MVGRQAKIKLNPSIKVNVDQAQLIEYNMVAVFKELRYTQVLSELARRLLPDHPAPLITEIPGQLLAVVYPDRRIECQFTNRRVLVTDKRSVTPGENPFGLVTLNALEAVSRSSGGDQAIVAYGYNYVLRLKEAGPTHYISTRFFSDTTKISHAFGGELQSIEFTAAVSIATAHCLASVTLRPAPNAAEVIEATVNYHYDGQSPALSAEEISRQVATKYDEFAQALRQL